MPLLLRDGLGKGKDEEVLIMWSDLRESYRIIKIGLFFEAIRQSETRF